MANERKAKNRLTNFNFKDDFCHVALVDAAANEHGILVMKAKSQERQSPVNKKADPNKTVEPKEDNMSEVEKEETVVVKNCGENHKAKDCPTCKSNDKKKEDTKMAKALELETEIQKNKDLNDQLEVFKAEKAVFKAEKEKAEKLVFVAKSMEQKNVVKEDVAEVLFKCSKALSADEYLVLSKAIETANTALEAMEVVTKSTGSSDPGAGDLSDEDKVIVKSKELMKEDSDLNGAAARTKARDILRKEANDAK